MENRTEEQAPPAVSRSRSDALSNLLALVLLIASATLIADFTRRLIAADADRLGLLSVVVQVVTAVVASSTFTKRGSALIDGSLTGGRSRRARTFVRLTLAAVCFSLTLLFWIYLPPWLAWRYYMQGLQAGLDLAQASQCYGRAIALDPVHQGFYVAEGAVMEKLYRYDTAEEQYRKALAANPSDPVAYNDLARLLILDGKPMPALKAVENGLALRAEIPVATAGLLKNKAWAEWLLGYTAAAISDAKQSQTEQKQARNANAAAASCLLGEIYGKLGKIEQARAEWQLFLQESKQSMTGQPAIEPDCQLNAEADNAKS